MSLSDGAPMMTMPVAPANSYGGGMGMWGENWIWIIVLFLFGWGRNGWGNNAGNSGGVVDGYVLTSDFANVERKIDSVNQGLCDGFYQQAQLVNGTNMAMANGFAQAELSRSNQQAALMQQLNAMRRCRPQIAAARIARLSRRCAMTWRRRRATRATPCRTRPATSSTTLTATAAQSSTS